MVEGAPLLRAYRLIPYRGFESLALRHLPSIQGLERALMLFTHHLPTTFLEMDSGCCGGFRRPVVE